MDKTDLTISLIRMRLVNGSVECGMSIGEAAIAAETFLKNNGLYGWMRKSKIAGCPESSIVTNVETYFHLVIRAAMSSYGTPAQVDTDGGAVAGQAIDAIEQHRSQFLGGQQHYPRNLYDYIWYRLETEMPTTHNMRPEDMGLSQDIVRSMTEKCIDYWKGHVGEIAQRYH